AEQDVFPYRKLAQYPASLRHIAEPRLGALGGVASAHVLAIEEDLPRHAGGQTHDGLHQRRLADTVAPQHTKAFALIESQPYPLQDGRLAIVGCYVVQTEHL